MGINYSSLADKRGLKKSNKRLKQSENSVQDLHGQLVLKPTVKEPSASENYYRPHDIIHNDSQSDDVIHSSSSHEQKVDNSSALSAQKIEQESLSRIEAELEAELEKLESNIMNSSRLEGKSSNVAEIDQDSLMDVVKGEQRADVLEARSVKRPYANRNETNSYAPHSLPYPVSPTELTLKLHELIRSRLEDHIKELEAALQNNNQMKLKIIESSSFHSSPDASRDRQQYIMDHPSFINLSGEPLSAHNEAHDVLEKYSESDDEYLRFGFENNGCRVQNGESRNAGLYQHYIRSQMNDVTSSSMEESDEEEDKMEMLLIRQIIEKAKQGSPAVLKAQRAFLLDQ